MHTASMPRPQAAASPGATPRIAGIFYLLTFVTGSLALLPGGARVPANLAATACYVAVILLFHHMFRIVEPGYSRLAVCFGLAGCAFGALSPLRATPFPINSLVFFGFYCLLIGYLILQSTFLPRLLGVGMVVAGLGWMTFFSDRWVHSLAPYNMLPGVLGEGALTLWLLVKGVDAERWKEQSSRRHV